MAINFPHPKFCIRRACLLALLISVSACTQPVLAPLSSSSPKPTASPTVIAGNTPFLTLTSTVEATAVSPTPSPLPLLPPSLQMGKGTIQHMAASPDGRWLAVVTTMGLYQYRLPSYTEAWLVPLNSRFVELAFSPDSHRLAVSTEEGSARVLDAETGETLAQMPTQDYARLAWSPDGKRLLTAAWCRTVTVWDASSGDALHELGGKQCSEGYNGISAGWSANGATIYITAADLEAFDADTYEQKADFHGAALTDWRCPLVVAAPAGNLLAVYDCLLSYSPVGILDGATGKQLFVLDDSVNGPAAAVAWAPDGQHLAVDYGGAGTYLWDASMGKVIQNFEDYFSLNNLAWLGDNRTLVGGIDSSGRSSALDTGSGQISPILQEHFPVGNSSSLTWSPAGLMTTDGVDLISWNASTGQPLQRCVLGSASLSLLSWPASGAGRFLFSPENGQAHWVGTPENLVPLESDTGIYPFPAAWSPNGRFLAGPGAIWDTNTGEVVTHLPAQPDGRQPDLFAWSPDHLLLALGDSLYLFEAHLADAATGNILADLPLQVQGVDPSLSQLAFSPDGRWLAAGGSLMSAGIEHGMVIIWDVQARVEAQRLAIPIQDEQVMAIAWSPDGKYLAAGGYSGQIVVFDMTNFTPLAQLSGHMQSITGLAFSPDSRKLASLSHNASSLLIWEISVP